MWWQWIMSISNIFVVINLFHTHFFPRKYRTIDVSLIICQVRSKGYFYSSNEFQSISRNSKFTLTNQFMIYLLQSVVSVEKHINIEFIPTCYCNHLIFRLEGLFQVRQNTEKRMIRIFFCSEIWSEPLRQSSKCIKSNKWTYSVQLKRSIYQSDPVKLCILFHLTLTHFFLYPFVLFYSNSIGDGSLSNKVITQV